MPDASLTLPRARTRRRVRRRPPRDKVVWWIRQVACLVWIADNVVDYARWHTTFDLVMLAVWCVLYVAVRYVGPVPTVRRDPFMAALTLALGAAFLVGALLGAH